MGLQRLRKEIESAKLAPETCFAVTIVTDSLVNVVNMSRRAPLGSNTSRRYVDCLRALKTLSDSFLGLEAKVTLELYWCPRNQTAQLREADFLAGHARKMRKWFYERNNDTRIDLKVRDGKKSNKSQGVKGPDVTMKKTAIRCPTEAEPTAKHTPQTRRRKIPTGNVVEEEVEDSLESASRQNKRQRMLIEEPQAASLNDEPQDTVPVPENTEDQSTDDGQDHLGGRRWYHCMVM